MAKKQLSKQHESSVVVKTTGNGVEPSSSPQEAGPPTDSYTNALRSPLDYNPLRIAGLFIGIALISLLVGLVLRGYIAHSQGVFFEKDLRAKLPISAQQQLAEFDLQKKSREIEIQKLDEELAALTRQQSNTIPLSVLIERRAAVKEELKTLESPIKLQPFYLSDTMFLWPWLFMCLGWLILLLRPDEISLKETFSKFHIIAFFALLLFILYRWPTWLRNFALGEEGQRVFAAANYKISPVYFYTQEIIILIICILLAIIWQQWALYYAVIKRRRSEKATSDVNAINFVFDITELDHLSALFMRWQLSSLVLAMGFLLYTNVFWQYVVRYKDQRYVVSAVIIHALWGMTWALLSLPMLSSWYSWYITRAKAISQIAQDPAITKSGGDIALKALQEINPVPIWNIAGSTITAIVTFLLPLVNAFRT